LQAGEAGGEARPPFDRVVLHAEILLRLRFFEDAVTVKSRWTSGPSAETEQLARLAELFFEFGQLAVADSLLEQALRDEKISVERRYNLMMRRADAHGGADRWQLMVDALQLLPLQSAKRRTDTTRLLDEWTEPEHAEVIGDLVSGTRDASLRYQLMWRQAVLTPGAKASADLIWQVAQADRLPKDTLAWACQELNRAKQPDRVIDLLESRLRDGSQLILIELAELKTAYEAVGRQQDAVRAGSPASAPPPPRPAQGGPGSFGNGGGFF
jgi:hypothetical protein